MKLTNPTDAQLNEAFAVHVAGWTWNEFKPSGFGPVIQGYWNGADGYYVCNKANFVNSADAVLPWLEKKQVWEAIFNNNPYTGSVGTSVLVADSFTEDLKEPSGRSGWVSAKTFAKAAVIALLRAHGVEIEFT